MEIEEVEDDFGSYHKVTLSTLSPQSPTPRLYDLLYDIEELVDQGYGTYEIDITVLRLRPHQETEEEARERKVAEANAEYNRERRGQ